MTDFTMFSPEHEDDEKDQRLIRDLQRLYHVEGRDSQFFTRLYARLEERATEGSGETRQRDNPQKFPPRRGERKRTGSSSGSSWRQRLSTLAAAVFVTLLVGSLVVVLSYAHRNSTGASQHVLQAIGMFSSLHMVDGQVGWALTDKGHLARTTDGGMRWHDVSPQSFLTTAPTNIATDFLTASLAWVAFSGNADSTTHVLRTTDGGQTWQDTTIPTGLVAQMTFTDPQSGWLLSKRSISENAETAEVFHTINGGKTWSRVSEVLASSADVPAPGHLPFGGKKAGMSFLNTTTGWMVGSVSVNGYILLYRTNDGGVTWHSQSLALTADEKSALISIAPPEFFTATDGILPVSSKRENTASLNFYVTHDGGASWQRTTALVALAAASDFIDMQHGWASDGTHLYTTGDGGQHWALLSPQVSLHGVSHLDFVSSNIGWAIGSLQSSGPSLLKTTDGGRTWTVIPWVEV